MVLCLILVSSYSLLVSRNAINFVCFLMLCLKIYLATFFFFHDDIFNIILRKYVFIFQWLVYNETFRKKLVCIWDWGINLTVGMLFGHGICKSLLTSRTYLLNKFAFYYHCHFLGPLINVCIRKFTFL